MCVALGKKKPCVMCGAKGIRVCADCNGTGKNIPRTIQQDVVRDKKEQKGKGGVANQAVYITKIDEDKDDVLMLTNGGIVEITHGFLGFLGIRKDAVLFKDGASWKIWIKGKKVYKCDLLKAPSSRASGSGTKVYISEVKGDGKILIMLDGSIYEVDDLYTTDTSLWLGNFDALLIDSTRLINFDESSEMVEVTKLK